MNTLSPTNYVPIQIKYILKYVLTKALTIELSGCPRKHILYRIMQFNFRLQLYI